MEENGDKCGLPVMAVDNVGTEPDNGKYSENCLAEECESLYIPLYIVGIWSVALEIELVIHEVELYTVVFVFHYTNMNTFAAQTVVHIEMSNILEPVAVFFWNTCIIRHYNSDIEFIFVYILRKSACNVCQTACFDERDTF